jgi:hypothetical protein
MDKTSLRDFLIALTVSIGIVLIAVGSSVLLENPIIIGNKIYTIQYISPKKEYKTFDFREYPVETIIFTPLWIGKPIPSEKYTCELRDSNLNVILKKCNVNITLDNITEGEYYLRFNYPARFVDGGIENYIAYFVVSLKKNGDILNISLPLEPAQYNDFPSIKISNG